MKCKDCPPRIREGCEAPPEVGGCKKSETFPDFDSHPEVLVVLEVLSRLQEHAQKLQENSDPYRAQIGKFLDWELNDLTHKVQTFKVKK